VPVVLVINSEGGRLGHLIVPLGTSDSEGRRPAGQVREALASSEGLAKKKGTRVVFLPRASPEARPSGFTLPS